MKGRTAVRRKRHEDSKGIMETIDMRRMRKGGALLVAALAVTACGTAEADIAQEGGTDFARVINVEVRPLATEEFVEDIRLTAVAATDEDRLIKPEEPGTVAEMYVDWGDYVEKGEPLAKMDDVVLRAQVDQARAEAELAAQTWERRRRLWEEDRVGSEIAYLEARYQSQRTVAALAALETRLERTLIVAPYAGVVEERRAGAGSIINQDGALLRLVEINPIIVHAGVPERYAPDVQVGDEALVTFDALGGAPYRGRVGYVGSTVSPDNRTFLILIGVPNSDFRIKPQMVANVALTRQAVSDAIVVPQDALVRVENGYVVFVVAERGGVQVAEARPVALGPARRNRVVIEDGVAVGEQLIVVGHRSVADGDRVNVVSRGG